MNITVTPEALDWFKREFTRTGTHFRVFPKYGFPSRLHPGFTLTIAVDSPREVAASATYDSLFFFIKEDDMWYFNGQDLSIHFDPQSEEINFDIH